MYALLQLRWHHSPKTKQNGRKFLLVSSAQLMLIILNITDEIFRLKLCGQAKEQEPFKSFWYVFLKSFYRGLSLQCRLLLAACALTHSTVDAHCGYKPITLPKLMILSIHAEFVPLRTLGSWKNKKGKAFYEVKDRVIQSLVCTYRRKLFPQASACGVLCQLLVLLGDEDK